VIRTFATTCACGALLLVGSPAQGVTAKSDRGRSNVASCDLAAASSWINRWFAAWELTSKQILHLPDAPPPTVVLYDSSCVYTTSEVTVAAPPVDNGPVLQGAKLPWRAALHGDSLTLPDASRVPVQLMSFANSDRKTGPFFVMAAPHYWGPRNQEFGLTPVFLHEFAHTRQVGGMTKIIGPIDSTWKYAEELDDDAVQTHFDSDSTYVAVYKAERDLLYRAAMADSVASVRALAAEALAMIRRRHARWFTGENAVFATLDDIFLSLEGAGQWAGYAWLAHPAGGRLTRAAAIEKMSGRRRRWSQDEGLGLFLVVDRLFPAWPTLVFAETSIGAVELLERSIQQ
jgi:hypothetical protein